MEREVGGGIGMGNTCKPLAVSFQCMTKSTTKKKKKGKKSKKKKRVTNKGLLHSTGNSAQCHVAAWKGEEFWGEWIHVCPPGLCSLLLVMF